jgi:hypothetical protein
LPPLGHSQKGTPDSPPCPSPSIAAKG